MKDGLEDNFNLVGRVKSAPVKRVNGNIQPCEAILVGWYVSSTSSDVSSTSSDGSSTSSDGSSMCCGWGMVQTNTPVYMRITAINNCGCLFVGQVITMNWQFGGTPPYIWVGGVGSCGEGDSLSFNLGCSGDNTWLLNVACDSLSFSVTSSATTNVGDVCTCVAFTVPFADPLPVPLTGISFNGSANGCCNGSFDCEISFDSTFASCGSSSSVSSSTSSSHSSDTLLLPDDPAEPLELPVAELPDETEDERELDADDTECDCANFCSAYSAYTFTLSGITNGSCFNCTAWNGTRTLVYTPFNAGFCGNCLWVWSETANTDFCFDGIGDRWFMANMNFNGFNGWHLFTSQSCTANPAGGGYADDYWLSGTFNPTGTNVFTHQTSFFCSNLPTTITVTPSGSLMSCPCSSSGSSNSSSSSSTSSSSSSSGCEESCQVTVSLSGPCGLEISNGLVYSIGTQLVTATVTSDSCNCVQNVIINGINSNCCDDLVGIPSNLYVSFSGFETAADGTSYDCLNGQVALITGNSSTGWISGNLPTGYWFNPRGFFPCEPITHQDIPPVAGQAQLFFSLSGCFSEDYLDFNITGTTTGCSNGQPVNNFLISYTSEQTFSCGNSFCMVINDAILQTCSENTSFDQSNPGTITISANSSGSCNGDSTSEIVNDGEQVVVSLVLNDNCTLLSTNNAKCVLPMFNLFGKKIGGKIRYGINNSNVKKFMLNRKQSE